MGNVLMTATGVYKSADSTEDVSLQELVTIVSQFIEEINGDFLTSLQGDQGFSAISLYVNGLAEMLQKGEPESYGFTNWCNFGFKEVYFGWGKPIWAGVDVSGLLIVFFSRIWNAVWAWRNG
jgi:shikimate O-hydroxycinnamoyltransferase